MLCFLILDISSPLRHTRTVPSGVLRARQHPGVMPCLLMTPSDQDMCPGSFTTWQRLIPFGLQRFSGVGQTQHPLRVADSQVCTRMAARGAWECVSTLTGCHGLTINRLSSREGEELPNIPSQAIPSPPPVNLPLLSAPGAGAHSGSILCAFAGVHTNPPARFLLFWTQEA